MERADQHCFMAVILKAVIYICAFWSRQCFLWFITCVCDVSVFLCALVYSCMAPRDYSRVD